MSRIYEARFAPIDKPTLLGRFDAYCFAYAQRHPEAVYVDREHGNRHIGRVRRVFHRDGWWTASFKLDHPAVEHGVEVGHPVSLEADAFRTRFGAHETCELKAISLVERPKIRGAEIVDVIEIADSPAVPTTGNAVDLAAAELRLLQERAGPNVLVRNFGRLTGIR